MIEYMVISCLVFAAMGLGLIVTPYMMLVDRYARGIWL